MKKTILATLAAALIASVAVPAMAAQGKGDGSRHGGPRIERMMDRFDADRDGSVTLEEVSAHRLAMFESADTDKSGSLSKDELKAFGDMRKEMRKQNREERRAERDNMKDGDRDGKMSKHGDRDGKMGKHGDRDGKMAGKHDGKGHGKRHGEGKGDHRGGMKLERLDTDKNGEISLEEFTSVDTKMFDRFDRNGDKKIDVTDFYRDRADNN